MTSDQDERRSSRAKVLLSGAIEHQGRSIPVKVANLSAHGARVSSPGLPSEDTPVVFHCNGAAIEGWVAWSRPPLAGIHFGTVAEDSSVLLRKKATAPSSTIRDNRKANHRRPGFRGKQLTMEEQQIVEDWRVAP